MTWDEMRKKYPAPEFPEDMSEERLKEYISDCFVCYESEGFSKLFWSQGGDYPAYQGKPFEVIGRAPTCDEGHPDGIELSCQPMWTIRFEDGHEMPAYPDEVVPSAMYSSGCPLAFLPQEFRERLDAEKQQTSQTASSNTMLSKYDGEHRRDLYVKESGIVSKNTVHEIVFISNEERFYCFVHGAGSTMEALGVFMKHHPYITYNVVVGHEEVQAMTDVKIVVEGGRVTDVYASKENTVMVEVIDRDVQDPEERDEFDEQVRQLEQQAASAQMFQVY